MSSKKITLAFYANNEKNVRDDSFILKNPVDSPYVLLVRELEKIGYECHTLDVFNKQNKTPDICLFLDIPKSSINKLINPKITKSIALLREAEMISPRNYDIKRHKTFDKILTWKENIIDNKKFFYFPSVKVNLKKRIDKKNLFHRKQICLINRNLKNNYEGELYSLRRQIVYWYERNNPQNFDLFGFNWDKYCFNIYGKNIYINSIFSKKLGVYKGISKNKLVTLSNYKFSICFENTNKSEYYLSEKIFDCFLSRTVPVYFGAPNIYDLLPKGVFIDYRKFRSIGDLNSYLHSMKKNEYMQFQEEINKFLNSKNFHKYSINNWLDTIINNINELH